MLKFQNIVAKKGTFWIFNPVFKKAHNFFKNEDIDLIFYTNQKYIKLDACPIGFV